MKTKEKPNELVIENRLDPRKVMAGDIMAIIYYVQVTSKNTNDHLVVRNLENGEVFQVKGKELIETCLSAELFNREEKLSRTDIATILVSSFNKPLTVCFEKLDGTERIMKCRLVKPEPLMGRSSVIDLEIDKSNHRLRQVDHRTLKFLIVDGVKYTVK